MEVTRSNVPNNDTSAGATPAVEGATPSQTTPVSPAAGAAPTTAATPATGDADLGEGGKSALQKERQAARDATARADAAEKELSDLKAAGQSDSEKAIAKARKEGADEVLTRVQTQVRSARVESALLAAGVDPSLLDLAARADEFTGLKVTDDGAVEGLADAIKTLKTARPVLFKAAPTAGTNDGGVRGQPGLTREAIEKMKPDEINARWDEVSKALSAH